MSNPKYRRMSPVRTARADELAYYATLNALLKSLRLDAIPEIRALFKANATPDPVQIKLVLEDLRDRNIPSDAEALRLATSFVESVNQRNIARTAQSALAANLVPTGLSLSAIIEEEKLLPIINASVFTNTRLIQNLPTKLLDDIEQVLMDYVTTPANFSEKGLTEQLAEKFGMSERRAKLIAVDQTHKINSALSRGRQTQLGVIGYEWSTSHDERVRERDKKLDGRFFLWNPMSNPPEAPNGKPFEQPPEDGAPGLKIMCRCVSYPVVDIDRIMKVATGS